MSKKCGDASPLKAKASYHQLLLCSQKRSYFQQADPARAPAGNSLLPIQLYLRISYEESSTWFSAKSYLKSIAVGEYVLKEPCLTTATKSPIFY